MDGRGTLAIASQWRSGAAEEVPARGRATETEIEFSNMGVVYFLSFVATAIGSPERPRTETKPSTPGLAKSHPPPHPQTTSAMNGRLISHNAQTAGEIMTEPLSLAAGDNTYPQSLDKEMKQRNSGLPDSSPHFKQTELLTAGTARSK